MKTNIVFIFILTFILFSCNNKNVPEFKYEDETKINGQLCYAANPLNPEKDTILCLRNVYVGFTVYDANYCSYVRNLLSLFGGKITECPHNFNHSWEYLAESEQYFYPTIGNQYVSVIDPNTGRIAADISLNDRDIYLKDTRTADSNKATHFYYGDFVVFMGSDYMKPKFITDTITPFGKQIILFDGHRGPIEGDSRLTNDNPYIFIK